jgi:hypothetical protein
MRGACLFSSSLYVSSHEPHFLPVCVHLRGGNSVRALAIDSSVSRVLVLLVATQESSLLLP